jgi:mannose-6-phosphate isomerase-like protein (cupin superfamily)
MKIIQKPWGREEWYEVNDKYVLKMLVVAPKQRLSLQYHDKKLETMLCVEGYGTLTLGETDYFLDKGSVHTIHPGQKHRLTAGDCVLRIIETSTPEIEDVVRIEDDYSRD